MYNRYLEVKIEEVKQFRDALETLNDKLEKYDKEIISLKNVPYLIKAIGQCDTGNQNETRRVRQTKSKHPQKLHFSQYHQQV